MSTDKFNNEKKIKINYMNGSSAIPFVCGLITFHRGVYILRLVLLNFLHLLKLVKIFRTKIVYYYFLRASTTN